MQNAAFRWWEVGERVKLEAMIAGKPIPAGLRRRSAKWLAVLLGIVPVGISLLGIGPAFAQAPEVETRLEEARQAIDAQEYDRARKILEPLAESGEARAQVGLGSLYATGRGVSQDDEEAVEWYQRAARQGHPIGQYNLGVCYMRGRGIEMDRVEALKWVSLSATQGFKPARTLHPALAASLDKEQREEGKRRAREWKPD